MIQAVPIFLPPSFFSNYQKACYTFLWKDSPPRIKYSRLTLPKSRDGIGFPDLHKYYTACHLTRIADWNIHANKKAWVSLEKDLLSGPLHLLPWLPPKSWPQSLSTHPLIHPSLLAFSKASRGGLLTSNPGALNTLRGNPAFPPGESKHFLKQDWPFEDVLALQFYDDGKPIFFRQN